MRKTYRYFLRGILFPGCIVAAPIVLAVLALSSWFSDRVVWWGPLLLVSVAIVVGIAAYFNYPVSVTVDADTIEVGYLFHGRHTFSRRDVYWRSTVPGALRARLKATGFRSSMLGTFALLTFLMENGAELEESLLGHRAMPPN